MKHIVIFLNYTQSRLDNLVFRQFAAESLYRRNSSLLFLSKSLEERELRHEVSELRKKQDGNEDVTFHVCARLVRSREGESVVNTLMLIRRLFQADVSNHYPVFVYGEMPALDEADDAVRKSVWHNLVVINNAVADHLEPIRSEFARISKDKAFLKQCYTDGAEKALRYSSRIVSKVYRKVGFVDAR